MSASTAIGMVSESLRNLLTGEMVFMPAVKVTVLAPDEAGGDRRTRGARADTPDRLRTSTTGGSAVSRRRQSGCAR